MINGVSPSDKVAKGIDTNNILLAVLGACGTIDNIILIVKFR